MVPTPPPLMENFSSKSPRPNRKWGEGGSEGGAPPRRGRRKRRSRHIVRQLRAGSSSPPLHNQTAGRWRSRHGLARSLCFAFRAPSSPVGFFSPSREYDSSPARRGRCAAGLDPFIFSRPPKGGGEPSRLNSQKRAFCYWGCSVSVIPGRMKKSSLEEKLAKDGPQSTQQTAGHQNIASLSLPPLPICLEGVRVPPPP